MNSNLANIINNSKSLQLLNAYESESDEDEKLSTSSTKRALNDLPDDIPVKRNKLEKLPLPSFVIETEKIREYEDDPSLHGGRIRNFPHERGNWATYIYLPYKGNEYFSQLVDGVADICLPITKLEIVNDFHISLTKTVILKYHWIESFVSTVRTKLNANCLKRFQLFFNSMEVYTNEEKTRTFLGLNINSGYDQLCDAVQIFNECLKEFKLNSFYEDPSFHISILWCVGDKKNELNGILHEINNFVTNFMDKNSDTDWTIEVNHFICKTGNKQFIF
ncbi:U6 snRNA phosphodiesterase, partial [Chrysoperla carnea]|uniref:U6 snRNA phosphodiesterase n=1 Tax=Chrysoperla carnea TaxID=189513 RepID=UPI001D08D72D